MDWNHEFCVKNDEYPTPPGAARETPAKNE